MKKNMIISMKKTLLLCLAFAVTFGISLMSYAADPKPTDSAKPEPAQLEGKIVAVDTAARLVTVEIRGTQIKVNVTPQVRLTKKGKKVKFDQLVSGQPVLLSFVTHPSGRIEVASLSL